MTFTKVPYSATDCVSSNDLPVRWAGDRGKKDKSKITRGKKDKLLLHACCGPCSTSVLERLSGAYGSITVYFYNPNITDKEEYERRKAVQINVIRHFLERQSASAGRQSASAGETAGQCLEKHGIGDFVASNELINLDFIEGPYEPKVFYEATQGLEEEAEGGGRCEICFRLRLAKTAEYAAKYGHEQFATTLSVSPHKDSKAIERIGLELGRDFGVDFLAVDFKKKAGYQRSVELSKYYGLYRQNYCGCFFSEVGGKSKK